MSDTTSAKPSGSGTQTNPLGSKENPYICDWGVATPGEWVRDMKGQLWQAYELDNTVSYHCLGSRELPHECFSDCKMKEYFWNLRHTAIFQMNPIKGTNAITFDKVRTMIQEGIDPLTPKQLTGNYQPGFPLGHWRNPHVGRIWDTIPAGEFFLDESNKLCQTGVGPDGLGWFEVDTRQAPYAEASQSFIGPAIVDDLGGGFTSVKPALPQFCEPTNSWLKGPYYADNPQSDLGKQFFIDVGKAHMEKLDKQILGDGPYTWTHKGVQPGEFVQNTWGSSFDKPTPERQLRIEAKQVKDMQDETAAILGGHQVIGDSVARASVNAISMIKDSIYPMDVLYAYSREQAECNGHQVGRVSMETFCQQNSLANTAPSCTEPFIAIGKKAPYKVFNFLNPRLSTIDIDDIAFALSKVPRWSGYTPKNYSVAEHCVVGSFMIADSFQAMEFLLHDAAEAYVGDLASPIKHVCTDYAKIHDRILEHILFKFTSVLGIHPSVKKLDIYIGEWERSVVREDPNFVPPVGAVPRFYNWDRETAEKQYIARFHELRRRCAL